MKVQINSSQKYPHFIGSWMLENPEVCNQLIDYFENNKGKQRPGIAGGGPLRLDVKDSIDISISPNIVMDQVDGMIFRDYFDQLFAFYADYINDWPFLSGLFDSLEIGSFNLQKYLPGQHFKKIHTERGGLSSMHRVFAFMTYLNDVEQGGSTLYSHYDLEVFPKKGLTLLWPAEWTHAHCGNPVEKGSKYIITGWLHFHC